MSDIEKAIEFIKNLMSDETDDLMYNDKIGRTILSSLEAQQADRWIPITEKLPEKGGYYLVSTEFETPRVMIGFYYVERNEWNYWMSTLPIRSVIAWRPLPYPQI